MLNVSLKVFQHKSQFESICSIERSAVEVFFNDSLDLIFPGMLRKKFQNLEELNSLMGMHLKDLERLLSQVFIVGITATSIIEDYSNQIIPMSIEIEKDAKALLLGDPAAKDLIEVILCYPGLFAIAAYRLAHFFNSRKVLIIPRLISEIAHEKTGIDIHPGAVIGESFFIDHGTGVVIGETAVIGNNVKIYQGVTLGALSVDKNLAETKRHPTIKDHCVIYSHATILGGETIIGENSVIGGNVWMTKSVPAHSMVYHKSEVKLDRVDQNIILDINKQEELTYEI
ncbi:MAG: serine acetyltransferase [Bacteriovorax sp.]|nr:serine acetyltransferase [Bacteriovorax sp.]